MGAPVATLVPGKMKMAARLARSGRMLRFDTMYSALGLRGRSEHATKSAPTTTKTACYWSTTISGPTCLVSMPWAKSSRD